MRSITLPTMKNMTANANTENFSNVFELGASILPWADSMSHSTAPLVEKVKCNVSKSCSRTNNGTIVIR